MTTTLNTHTTIPSNSAEVRSMIPEEWPRIRAEELRGEAERQRRIHRLTAGRWWAAVARFAGRRAERATRHR